MTTSAELSSDFVNIHLVALGAQTDACQIRCHFFKHTGHNHRFNSANMIDQTLRVVRVRAGSGKVGLLQPKVGNLVVMRQAEIIIGMLQQPDAGQGND